MLLEIKCPFCGSPDYLVLADNENGIVLVCENEKCKCYNHYMILDTNFLLRNMYKNIELKNGYTGTIEFEIKEEGKFKETFKDGISIKGYKFENNEWKEFYASKPKFNSSIEVEISYPRENFISKAFEKYKKDPTFLKDCEVIKQSQLKNSKVFDDFCKKYPLEKGRMWSIFYDGEVKPV